MIIIINPPIKLDWVAKMFQAPIHQGTMSSIIFFCFALIRIYGVYEVNID